MTGFVQPLAPIVIGGSERLRTQVIEVQPVSDGMLTGIVLPPMSALLTRLTIGNLDLICPPASDRGVPLELGLVWHIEPWQPVSVVVGVQISISDHARSPHLPISVVGASLWVVPRVHDLYGR